MQSENSVRKAEPSLLSLILRPHRSLSRFGFFIFMAAVLGMYMAVGGYFFAIGAWAVFGFMGSEVLLLYILFRLNYRDARAFETVDLTRSKLAVQKVDPRGRAEGFEFQPHWLRVDMDDPPEQHSQLTIGSHGKTLTLGSFLTPPERLEVAREIRGGLRKIRFEA